MLKKSKHFLRTEKLKPIAELRPAAPSIFRLLMLTYLA